MSIISLCVVSVCSVSGVYLLKCSGGDELNLPNLRYVENLRTEYPNIFGAVKAFIQKCPEDECFKEDYLGNIRLSNYDYNNDGDNEMVLISFIGGSGGITSIYFIENGSVLKSYSLVWQDCIHYKIHSIKDDRDRSQIIKIKGTHFYDQQTKIDEEFSFD